VEFRERLPHSTLDTPAPRRYLRSSIARICTMGSALEWDVAALQSATGSADGDPLFESAAGLYKGTTRGTLRWSPASSTRSLSSVTVQLADKAIAGFTVRTDHIAEALNRTPILVTALNPVIGYAKGEAGVQGRQADPRCREGDHRAIGEGAEAAAGYCGAGEGGIHGSPRGGG
jgi:hypothetical protein